MISTLRNKYFQQAELLIARSYYFLYMGSWGFVLPFMNLYFTSLGFSGKQVGFITSTAAVVGLFAAPIVVNTVKRNPHARTYLQIILTWGAIGYFLIGRQGTFLAIIVVIIFQSLANSSLSSLNDTMAISVARETERGYGSIRVWGSVGWILAVPISGWLIEHLGYQAGFNGVTIGWLSAALILSLIGYRHFTNPNATNQAKTALRETVRQILSNRILLGFAIAILATGFLNNGVQQFENVFLSDLGASKQLISFAGILSAIVELPFMLLSDKILKKIGPHRMMMLALAMTLLQRSAVLIWPSIITIMIVRFIGGIAFSFYTISYIGLISRYTKPAETGTVLALFTVTLAGLVNIVASPIAGAMYDIIGARWLYACAATGYAIATASLWLTKPVED